MVTERTMASFAMPFSSLVVICKEHLTTKQLLLKIIDLKLRSEREKLHVHYYVPYYMLYIIIACLSQALPPFEHGLSGKESSQKHAGDPDSKENKATTTTSLQLFQVQVAIHQCVL